MSQALKERIARRLGDRALFDEPMRRHTTWRLGGPAWCLAKVLDQDEAAWLVKACAEAGMPYKALGRGSNLLVSDQGYTGVMINLGGELARIEQSGQGMVCGGGAHLPAAVRLAAKSGLAGLEWAVGIPASVGGALATNAGAHGGDMAGLAHSVRLLLDDGSVRDFAGGELPAGYRRRRLPAGSLVLGVGLSLSPSDPAKVQAKRAALLDLRRSRQPLSARTAGSIFKNPPGDYAGRLIEAAGLKGLAVGDAAVSRVHANFIETRGRARAGDVLALMDLVSERVMQSFRVRLEPEVEVVGNA